MYTYLQIHQGAYIKYAQIFIWKERKGKGKGNGEERKMEGERETHETEWTLSLCGIKKQMFLNNLKHWQSRICVRDLKRGHYLWNSGGCHQQVSGQMWSRLLISYPLTSFSLPILSESPALSVLLWLLGCLSIATFIQSFPFYRFGYSPQPFSFPQLETPILQQIQIILEQTIRWNNACWASRYL